MPDQPTHIHYRNAYWCENCQSFVNRADACPACAAMGVIHVSQLHRIDEKCGNSHPLLPHVFCFRAKGHSGQHLSNDPFDQWS